MFCETQLVIHTHQSNPRISVPLVVFGLAFALKAVDLVHVVRLVVAAVQEETVRAQPLVSVQEEGNLAGPGTSVDKVAVEEVPVLLVGGSVSAEELHKIKILACAPN